MDNQYRLSVEEWALALSLGGAGEQSEALLRTYLGDLNDDDIRERMHAAGHSLIARGLLDLDDAGAAVLDTEFSQCVQAMTAADYSLRFGRSNKAVDMYLTYHFKDGRIYEQALEYGVVIELKQVKNAAAAASGGLAFYEVEGRVDFKAGQISLPYSVLESFTEVDEDVKIEPILAEHGVPEKERALLAQDLADNWARGSVLLVTYPADGLPQSDFGFLTLEGPERLWLVLLEGEGDAMQATLKPGVKNPFIAEVKALLKEMEKRG